MHISICNEFETIARKEDRARRKLIPCFDDFFGALLRALMFSPDDDFSLLELGAGSGFLSELILHRWPKARITLVDINEKKLEHARMRLSGHEGQLNFILADFARTDPPGKFDAVVSALAIHHIGDLDKRTLYRSLYYSLNSGGILVIADRVRGSTIRSHQIYGKVWETEVSYAGASQADIIRAKIAGADDFPSPLNEQLGWLRNSGFVDIDVHYKNALFTVFGGNRSNI